MSGNKESHAGPAFLEVKNTETQEQRPASERQKQLIQKLSQERNLQLDISLESLDMSTASGIINMLLNPDGETSRDENRVGCAAPGRHVDRIKLGMAMKLVYNSWR